VFSDIEQLSALASQHRIADSTVGIPHPYTAEFARMWIASHPVLWEHHRALHWAALEIDDIDNRHILGYVGLSKIDFDRKQAELRFWVGCGAKRKEYATEWCEAVLQFASAGLDMARVYALQIARHPLAGRVLADLGMRPEGYVRKRVRKEGLIEDIVCWGLVRNEREPGLRGNWSAVRGNDRQDSPTAAGAGSADQGDRAELMPS
jgi:RimJ/RimL family protein N-acetyltransferase